MAKRTAAFWLETELYERLQRIAAVDRRSMSQVIAMAIGHGLPALEGEIAHKLTPAAESAPPYRPGGVPATDPVGAAVGGLAQAAVKYSKRKTAKKPAAPEP